MPPVRRPRPGRRAAAALLAVGTILGVAGVVGPVSSAGATPEPAVAPPLGPSPEATPGRVEPADDAGIQQMAWWIACPHARGMTILLSTGGGCNRLTALGWVDLSTISGGHQLQICNFSYYAVHGIIDPVGPEEPIWYNDQPGGDCYTRPIGYPIQKFQGYWDGMFSLWQLP